MVVEPLRAHDELTKENDVKIPQYILLFLVFGVALMVLAGTDQGGKPPDFVRSSIAESAARWASHPTGVPTSLCTAAGVPHACCTGNAVGVCDGVVDCTAAGIPAACCNGNGVGSCLPVNCGGAECCADPATDQECENYAVLVDQGVQRQAWLIEQQTVGDANFVCNPYVPDGQQNGETFCRTFPATQTVVDSFVANACSFLASQ